MKFSFLRRKKNDHQDNPPPLVLNAQNCDPYLSEQIRALRARYEKRTEALDWKVLAVTSASAGEGKTFSSANLAVNLATDGRKKVLLMDFDLRNSELAKGMGISSIPGLSEFLSGTVQLNEIVRNSFYNGLYVIPCGAKISNPTDLFTKITFKTFFKEIRNQYDYIIVDTPPVIPVSDALIIREHVDGFIFVVRSGFANYNLIKQAVDELGEDRILGVIVNGVKLERNRFYKRYYGKYYTPPQKNR